MPISYCHLGECQKLPDILKPKCTEGYTILLPDQCLELILHGLWEHYALEHFMLPPADVKEKVMAAKVALIEKKIWRKGGREIVPLYFVKKKEDGHYNMVQGNSPDRAFAAKLKSLLESAEYYCG